MRNTKRFPFIERRNQAGETNVFPCVPITLSYRDCILEAWGLLDTGSSLNVLPYHNLGIVEIINLIKWWLQHRYGKVLIFFESKLTGYKICGNLWKEIYNYHKD